jgi:predicted cupin superfamily sugar epimerase
MLTAAELIALLDLQPLPREGGYYRETYRSRDLLPAVALGTPRDRSAGTAIYYLLTPETLSALHRLPTDEIFHFYLGDPVEMLQLLPDGSGRLVILGNDLRAGHRPQIVVPAGTWQGSRLISGGGFALMGTTMAPGFDFDDYEHGDRDALVKHYAAFAEHIAKLG